MSFNADTQLHRSAILYARIHQLELLFTDVAYSTPVEAVEDVKQAFETKTPQDQQEASVG